MRNWHAIAEMRRRIIEVSSSASDVREERTNNDRKETTFQMYMDAFTEL